MAHAGEPFSGQGITVVENREAVNDAGFTFRSGDVADLADRLQFLIANPAVREAAGQAAKRRVREHYQWPQIAMEIERVYFRDDGVGTGGDGGQEAEPARGSSGAGGEAEGEIRQLLRSPPEKS